MIVSLGLPIMHHGGLFNTACLVADGRILGFVAKQNLASDGIHYEPRWFKPWREQVCVEAELAGGIYPLGDLIFRCGDVQLGFEICEDAWVGNRPGADLARRNVDMILNPSASHFAFGKHEVRNRFVLEGSRAFHVTYVYANLLGNEAGRAIYDGDAMIATGGRMAAVGPRFSFADFHLTTAVVDVDATRMIRARSGSFRVELDNAATPCVTAPFDFPRVGPEPETIRSAAWEAGPYVKEGRVRSGCGLGVVRLSAEEPLPRIRRLDQRGRGFRDGRGIVRFAGRLGPDRIGTGAFRPQVGVHPGGRGCHRPSRPGGTAVDLRLRSRRRTARRSPATQPVAWRRRWGRVSSTSTWSVWSKAT